MNANEAMPSKLREVSTGILKCTSRAATAVMPNTRLQTASRRGRSLFGNHRGNRYTMSAPTVIPNIAIEIATKAKWYHIVTLKIRVSRIS